MVAIAAAVARSWSGWSAGCCCSQITDGLVDAGSRRRSRRRRARPRRPRAGSQRRQQRLRPGTQLREFAETSSRAARSAASTWSCSVPVGRRGGRIAGGGTQFSPGVEAGTCPAPCVARSRRGPSTAWTYTKIRYLPGEDQRPTCPGWPSVSQLVLPADGGTYGLYLLFPMTEEQDTLGLVPALPAHGRRAAADAARRARLAGHPPGGHAGPAGPPGRRADRVRPARGADARRRAGRHRPAGDLVQPDGRRAAAADPPARGAVAGCSASSSPTCPTSCARR